ncbi:MAG: hypothetical protein R8M45_06595 [Ghiorsea sp.]
MSIKELAAEMRDLKDLISAQKAETAVLQARFDMIRKVELPTEMDEAGVESTRLAGIGTVLLTADIYSRFAVGKEHDALKWLEDTGHGGMIKETVHAGTLKAFLKSELTEGHEVPAEFFTVEAYTRASIRK